MEYRLLKPALYVLHSLPVVLDLALGLGEDLLELVHLLNSIEFNIISTKLI